jgi:hypothetical protein
MVSFYPVWSTPVGPLQSVDENSTYSIPLTAIRTATFMGEDSVVVEVGPSAANITNAYVNSSESSFSTAGNAIVFANTVATTDVVKVITNETITYTLLHDNLPPGLVLSNAGLIQGKVTALPTLGNSVIYKFAVRASDGTFVRDRQFSIEAIPISAAVVPPSWGRLPAFQYDNTYGLSFVPLGTQTRGTPFVYQIPVNQPGGLPPTLHIEPIIDVAGLEAPFNTIPDSLILDPHTGIFSGEVDTDMPLGQYFFRVVMRDNRDNEITSGSGSIPRIFMLDVTPPQDVLAPLRFIKWQTPEGLLATIYEGQSSPVGVFATCTTGETVSYQLLSTSQLPNGLILNSATGDLQGVFGHVPADKTNTFAIRASVGDTFVDREFSIKVLSRYRTETSITVSFKLRMPEVKPMRSYYGTVINDYEYFRPTDANFGMVGSDNTLSIYVIGGLQGDFNTIGNAIRTSQIGGPISLRLGEHKIAYAKLNGKVVYEVLYRDVIDPMKRAGGYTLAANAVPVSDTLEWPQSNPASPLYLHPSSVNNIRNDFAQRVGFRSQNGTLDHTVGTVAENMPLWMASPQTGNDTSTTLGFTVSVPVAYLKPGYGEAILDRISVRTTPDSQPMDDSNPLNRGHQVDFDQYYVTFQSVSTPTTFYDCDRDIHAPFDPAAPRYVQVFDDNNTTFDVYVYQDGKYFRINNKTAGSSS